MEGNNDSIKGSFKTNRELLSDMHDKTTKMYNVIYGDNQAGIPGISHRVKSLEDSDKKRTGAYVFIASLASGISLGIKFIIDHFNK